MKILVLNGSPRKNGDTAALLEAFLTNLGGEVYQIHAYDGQIHPCTDCRWCVTHAACALQDAMQEVYTRIDEADVIVMASPIYFSELTGPLLSVASRLQYLWVSKYLRKTPVLSEKTRYGVILLAGGGDGAADKAISTATCLLHQMGAEVYGMVCSHNTNHVPVAEDAAALAQVRTLQQAILAEFAK